MKKIFSILAILFVSFFFVSNVNAEGENVVFDPLCTKYLVLGSFELDDGSTIETIDPITNRPFCNERCEYSKIYNTSGGRLPGVFCKYGSTTETIDYNSDIYSQLPIEIPQEDAILIWIRGGIYAVMGFTSLALILYGLYGWYLRAMSEGQEDKIRESIKVYQNAIIGGIIVFVAALIAQLVFMFLGVTESILEFNFIPKSGYVVEVYEKDIGRYCYSNQVDKNNVFICVDNKWVKQ